MGLIKTQQIAFDLLKYSNTQSLVLAHSSFLRDVQHFALSYKIYENPQSVFNVPGSCL